MSARPGKSVLNEENRINILDAAITIVRQGGWDELSMRRIASHIGFSTPIIYAYFPNKESIIFELMRLGFMQLRLALETAAQVSLLPRLQLESIWKAYWTFARENQETYRIMYGIGVPCPAGSVNASEKHDLTQAIETVIRKLSGQLPAGRIGVTSKCEYLLALIQGLVSIHLTFKTPPAVFCERVFMDAIKVVADL
jgi:AcrR family transcriptional regulator